MVAVASRERHAVLHWVYGHGRSWDEKKTTYRRVRVLVGNRWRDQYGIYS